MKKAFFLIILFIAWFNINAQIKFDQDTTINKKLINILHTYKSKYRHTQFEKRYYQLKSQADTLLLKIEFIDAVVNDSYYGGEKSGVELKNDLISPVMSADFVISSILENDLSEDMAETGNNFSKIDSILNAVYNSKIKNKDRNLEVDGDDDENRLIEVEVRVLESFAGKKEIPGYEVYCKTPFVANNREDFNPTTYAKKRISAGYRMFYIKKGKLQQQKLFRIVYKDTDTHLILFSNSQSQSTK